MVHWGVIIPRITPPLLHPLLSMHIRSIAIVTSVSVREMAESEVRFASASEEDIATLLSNKDSLNTKRATKVAVAVLQGYEKEKSTDFLSLPV